jgi:Cyclin-dependent kinase regulatory subunit.
LNRQVKNLQLVLRKAHQMKAVPAKIAHNQKYLREHYWKSFSISLNLDFFSKTLHKNKAPELLCQRPQLDKL